MKRGAVLGLLVLGGIAVLGSAAGAREEGASLSAPGAFHDLEPVLSLAQTAYWHPVPANGLPVMGRNVEVAESRGQWSLVEGGKRISRLDDSPTTVRLKRTVAGKRTTYSVRVRLVPGGRPEVGTGMGVEIRHGDRSAWVLDLDLDGEYFEEDGDGLVLSDSGTVGAYAGEAWFPGIGLRVVKGESAELEKIALGAIPEEHGLCVLNHYRQIAGLPPVVGDAELARGCEQHAKYVLLNWNLSFNHHTEDRANPLYCEEGARAAASSLFGYSGIGYSSSFAGTITGNLDIVYHRKRVLDPNLARAAFGSFEGRGPSGGPFPTPTRIFVIALEKEGRRRELEGRLGLWPARGQKRVPLTFNGLEQPMPLPADVSPSGHGYPVTVTFPSPGAVERTELTVRREGGEPLDGFSYGPDRTISGAGTYAYAYDRNSGMCHFISRRPLDPRTRYVARLTYEAGGKTRIEEWWFETGSSAVSPRE